MTDQKQQEQQKQAQAAGRAQQQHLTSAERQMVEERGAVQDDGKKEKRPKIRIDLHCHTEASPDCITPLETFPEQLRAAGIRVQAITDHNVIWGAQELQQIVSGQQNGNYQDYPLTIIVGEEISTTEGELIGLFLNEPIPGGLTPEETVEQINQQGGLVLLPHGFDPLKRFRLQPAALERIADSVDIVETFNARVSRPKWNQAAVEWSKANDLPMSAGSDAHRLADVGTAWVEVDAPIERIQTPEDLLKVLGAGVPEGKWTHP
ncbi:MAG TPA: PHP domain-containing protein, partial [Anaerolineales bacterium]|nr:PHP domain-containing protein [Anaerolineales bacterium]